jgi:hypothetical protein
MVSDVEQLFIAHSSTHHILTIPPYSLYQHTNQRANL